MARPTPYASWYRVKLTIHWSPTQYSLEAHCTIAGLELHPVTRGVGDVVFLTLVMFAKKFQANMGKG